MDFASLVLMEREKETNYLIKEMGSYEVGEGAEYVTKLFYDGEKVNLYFDTKKDVEEWEYTAIYDLFNEDRFIENDLEIDIDDNEFNPTWILNFDYIEEHEEFKEKLNSICNLIEEEIKFVLQNIEGKKDEYVE
ncbi:DUF6762 family protein [Clostridium ihumii]|uniref:DUF6762 family protein n=1 Tax=Clostridium ihumii TaxID=1470356 RepID=UPI00058FDB32|nr:DUF6762 family protein [Clostridium ihumii]